MLKTILQVGLTVTAVAVLVGVVAFSRGHASASATCADGPTSYSWKGTLSPYGIRDYSVAYCGPDTLDLYAGAHWKGNKAISVALIAPDGSQQVFTGARDAGGEVDGPVAQGTWTIVVRSDSSSSASSSADMSLKEGLKGSRSDGAPLFLPPVFRRRAELNGRIV